MSEPTTEQLSAFLDHELDASAQSSVAQHVATCSDCQGRLDALRQAAQAIRGLPMEAPPRTFTIPAQQERRWRWAPVGWAGSLAVAMLIVVVGVTHLNFGPGGSAGSATSAGNSGNLALSQQQAHSAAGSGAAQRDYAPAAAANQVQVVDPSNRGRSLTVWTDHGSYPSNGSITLRAYAAGGTIGNFGRVELVLRRGSYGVDLSRPTETAASSTSMEIEGTYSIASLALPGARQGSYVLMVTWTDSSGVALIAELPITITP